MRIASYEFIKIYKGCIKIPEKIGKCPKSEKSARSAEIFIEIGRRPIAHLTVKFLQILTISRVRIVLQRSTFKMARARK